MGPPPGPTGCVLKATLSRTVKDRKNYAEYVVRVVQYIWWSYVEIRADHCFTGAVFLSQHRQCSPSRMFVKDGRSADYCSGRGASPKITRTRVCAFRPLSLWSHERPRRDGI